MNRDLDREIAATARKSKSVIGERVVMELIDDNLREAKERLLNAGHSAAEPESEDYCRGMVDALQYLRDEIETVIWCRSVHREINRAFSP